MKMERESDSKDGFVRKAVVMRFAASLRWCEEHKRGIKRLICVSSSWFREVVVFVLVVVGSVWEDDVKGKELGVKRETRDCEERKRSFRNDLMAVGLEGTILNY